MATRLPILSQHVQQIDNENRRKDKSHQKRTNPYDPIAELQQNLFRKLEKYIPESRMMKQQSLNRSFDLSSGQNLSAKGNRLNMSMQANEIQIAKECTTREDLLISSFSGVNKLENSSTNQMNMKGARRSRAMSEHDSKSIANKSSPISQVLREQIQRKTIESKGEQDQQLLSESKLLMVLDPQVLDQIDENKIRLERISKTNYYKNKKENQLIMSTPIKKRSIQAIRVAAIVAPIDLQSSMTDKKNEENLGDQKQNRNNLQDENTVSKSEVKGQQQKKTIELEKEKITKKSLRIVEEIKGEKIQSEGKNESRKRQVVMLKEGIDGEIQRVFQSGTKKGENRIVNDEGKEKMRKSKLNNNGQQIQESEQENALLKMEQNYSDIHSQLKEYNLEYTGISSDDCSDDEDGYGQETEETQDLLEEYERMISDQPPTINEINSQLSELKNNCSDIDSDLMGLKDMLVEMRVNWKSYQDLGVNFKDIDSFIEEFNENQSNQIGFNCMKNSSNKKKSVSNWQSLKKDKSDVSS